MASERFTFWAKSGLALDHAYKTVPQINLNQRELAYHRGKGLGGSSATNLAVWDYGSKPEYDEWARLVNDDTWNWENTVSRFKRVGHIPRFNSCGRASSLIGFRSNDYTTSLQRSMRDMFLQTPERMDMEGKNALLILASTQSSTDINRPVDVTLPAEWDPTVPQMLSAIEQYGVYFLPLLHVSNTLWSSDAD